MIQTDKQTDYLQNPPVKTSVRSKNWVLVQWKKVTEKNVLIKETNKCMITYFLKRNCDFTIFIILISRVSSLLQKWNGSKVFSHNLSLVHNYPLIKSSNNKVEGKFEKRRETSTFPEVFAEVCIKNSYLYSRFLMVETLPHFMKLPVTDFQQGDEWS